MALIVILLSFLVIMGFFAFTLIWYTGYKDTAFTCRPLGDGSQKVFEIYKAKLVKEQDNRTKLILRPGSIPKFFLSSKTVKPTDKPTETIYRYKKGDLYIINYVDDLNYEYLSWPKWDTTIKAVPQSILTWWLGDNKRRMEKFTERDWKYWLLQFAPYGIFVVSILVSAFVFITVLQMAQEGAPAAVEGAKNTIQSTVQTISSPLG